MKPEMADARSPFARGTAIMDFCEANYAHSHLVAEWWGTVSAGIMMAYGIGGAAVALQHGIEGPFQVLWLLLGAVGLGTGYLHATLAFVGQMTDELPLLMLSLGLFYSLVATNLASTLGQRGSRALAVALVCFASVVAWYMVTGADEPIFFRVCLGAIMTAIVGQEVRLYWLWKARRIRVLYERAFVTFLVGFAGWLVDEHACAFVSGGLGIGLPNPQLHAWWHILTGLSAHCTFVWLLVIRAEAAKKPLPASLGRSAAAKTILGLRGYYASRGEKER
jgi:dihydroceramidase